MKHPSLTGNAGNLPFCYYVLPKNKGILAMVLLYKQTVLQWHQEYSITEMTEAGHVCSPVATQRIPNQAPNLPNQVWVTCGRFTSRTCRGHQRQGRLLKDFRCCLSPGHWMQALPGSLAEAWREPVMSLHWMRALVSQPLAQALMESVPGALMPGRRSPCCQTASSPWHQMPSGSLCLSVVQMSQQRSLKKTLTASTATGRWPCQRMCWQQEPERLQRSPGSLMQALKG